jgi:Leucine-rich repeat (LRR) protein
MKPQLPTFLICGLLLSPAHPIWARQWTDNTGKHSIEAELVEVKDGMAVLKKSGGKTVDVPLNRLSTADRIYIQSREKPAQKAESEYSGSVQEAITAIRKLGGSVTVDQQRRGKPIEGGGYTVKNSWHFKDLDLRYLKVLPDLRSLDISFTQVSDLGLECLKNFNNLETLKLGSKVTDAGLEHLKGLTKLEWLGLGGTQVTDTGMELLKNLTKLKSLYLDATQVTKEGVKNLKAALPQCFIKSNWN